MKILLVSLLFCSTSISAEETFVPRYLHYQYSENVIVTISNISCSLKTIDAKYKLAAIATRVDGQVQAGCYAPISEDMLEFQWYAGDKVVIPANAFLLNHLGPENTKPPGKPVPKIDV